MKPERYLLIAELFEACVELDAAGVDALLGERCAGDPELEAQVRRVLEHDEPFGGVDEAPLRDLIDSVLEAEHRHDQIPETVGKFRIRRVLGEGGMGVVYEAEQDEPDRLVALKVIRNVPTKELADQMKREADLLARVEAPGVARVYESGVADCSGRQLPYIAMEMIDGVPIDRFVEEAGLSVDERIMLLARTATALQSAHTSGVIHRDVKPANILVIASGESEPRPVLVDFGIASEQRTGETVTHTIVARTGIVGTLAYMSPEQIGDAPVRPDTRADVYSLGAIAFLVLSGEPLHDLSGLGFLTAIRKRTESRSRRIGTVNRKLRGDIELVISKATASAREERYETAAAFADDLRRVESGYPIEARRSSALHQLSRFALRNKVAVVLGLGVLLTLGVALGYSIRERQRAVIEADTSQFISEYLQNAVLTTSPNERGKDVTVREVIEANESEISDRFAERPMIEANLRMVLGLVFRSLGDEAASLRNYERAAELYEQELGLRNRTTLFAKGRVGVALRNNDRYLEAINTLEKTLEVQRDRFGDLDDDALITMNSLSVAFSRTDQLERAIGMQEELLDVRLRRGDAREFLATIMHNLGTSYVKADRIQMGIDMVFRAEREYEAVGNPTAALTTRHFRGRSHNMLDEFDVAEPILREGLAAAEELLPGDHYLIRLFCVSLGEACIGLGRIGEARALLTRSLELSESGEVFTMAPQAREMLEQLDSNAKETP